LFKVVAGRLSRNRNTLPPLGFGLELDGDWYGERDIERDEYIDGSATHRGAFP